MIADIEAARVIDANAANSHHHSSAAHIVAQLTAPLTGTAGTPMGLRSLVRAAKYVDPVERLAFAAGRPDVGHNTGPGARRRDAALGS